MEKAYMKETCFFLKKRKKCYFMFIKLEILMQYGSVKSEKAEIKTKQT